jgi:hypothetical protein
MLGNGGKALAGAHNVILLLSAFALALKEIGRARNQQLVATQLIYFHKKAGAGTAAGRQAGGCIAGLGH